MPYYILRAVMFKYRCSVGRRDRLTFVCKVGVMKHTCVLADVCEGVSHDVVVQRRWTVDAVERSSTFWLI